MHFPPNKELQKEFAAQIDVLVTISVFYDLSPGHLTEEMLFQNSITYWHCITITRGSLPLAPDNELMRRDECKPYDYLGERDKQCFLQ